MVEMAECPMCKGAGGCPICTDGKVKRVNLDRAREGSGWSDEAIDRLWRMLVGPIRCRREKINRQRAWLEANDGFSRLDREDRKLPPE